ncbi:glycosyltransferase family 2 protein [bacterium]|nr:glycosyltransferase family 2 protein [candidate division CSSED10-310 bacterium]
MESEAMTVKNNLTFSNHVLPEQAFEMESRDLPDVSICLVNWNTCRMLKECLESIEKNIDTLNIEIFVIDNASSDGSADMVRREYPTVTLIENVENVGFSRANNQGINIARGRNIFLLNPDTIILPGALADMVSFLDTHPSTGAVAARLLNSDGSLQYSLRHFPDFLTPFTENTNLAEIPGIHRFSKRSRLMDWAHDTIREVEQPAGAAFMIKRKCIDTLGSLNSCYHMFFEDVDICYRIRRSGWMIFYLPNARIIHHGGQSVKKRTDMGTQFYRSLIKYFRFHRGRYSEFAIRTSMVGISIYCIAWSLVEFLRRPARGIVIGKSAINVIRAAFFRVPNRD